MIGSNNLFLAWTLINQSSVKKLPIAYVHNQSMFLKTSGLNHKWFMLHCLVFKEQLCLSKLSLQATHLLYRISFRLSRTFLFFFFVWVICSSKALPIKEYFLARPMSRGDLYYITGWWCICQHLFLKNCKVFLSSCSKTKNAPITRCVILAIGGGTEIWTPDTAGMNRML